MCGVKRKKMGYYKGGPSFVTSRHACHGDGRLWSFFRSTIKTLTHL